MSTAQMPCPRCKGDGHVELTPPLAEAMKAIDYAGGSIISSDLAARLCLSQPNAVARLERLRRAGVLKRERTVHPTGGVEFVYSRSDQ